MKTALVLGARPGSGNIGDEVLNQLAIKPHWRGFGWHVEAGGSLPGEGDWGEYDALVCCLGRAYIKPLHEVHEQILADLIRANLALPLAAAGAYLRERGERGGALVFIGSYAHDHVLSNSVAYCAAKAGLAHATRCLAWDYERFRFYTVHPYHVAGTPMERYVIEAIKEGKGLDDAGARAYQRKDLRMRWPNGELRELTAEEVAAAVVDLIANDRPWMNGANIPLYGGVR